MTNYRTRFSQSAPKVRRRQITWHGHFKVDMIDSLGQWPLSLIGKFKLIMSASTRYPATPTLIHSVIGYAQYIQQRPSQFCGPYMYVPPCTHGNDEIFEIKIVLLQHGNQADIHYHLIDFRWKPYMIITSSYQLMFQTNDTPCKKDDDILHLTLQCTVESTTSCNITIIQGETAWVKLDALRLKYCHNYITMSMPSWVSTFARYWCNTILFRLYSHSVSLDKFWIPLRHVDPTPHHKSLISHMKDEKAPIYCVCFEIKIRE